MASNIWECHCSKNAFSGNPGRQMKDMLTLSPYITAWPTSLWGPKRNKSGVLLIVCPGNSTDSTSIKALKSIEPKGAIISASNLFWRATSLEAIVDVNCDKLAIYHSPTILPYCSVRHRFSEFIFPFIESLYR